MDYKGNLVGQARLDLVVDGQLVVELKATEGIAPIHVAQLLSYLKAVRLRLGRLITFKVAFLRIRLRGARLDLVAPPAKERLLHRILGAPHVAEHAVRERDEVPAKT
ncbi:GxxExxY protein [Sorangium sp. So ce327]